MTRRAGVTLAAVALGAGVFVSGAKAAAPLCGSKQCAEEIAAGCAGLSGAALKACKSSILDQCNAGLCTCTGQPGLPDCPVTTTTSTTTSPTTTTQAPVQCCVPGSPMGAFACVLETASDCSSAGGVNRGAGTCDPNPCCGFNGAPCCGGTTCFTGLGCSGGFCTVCPPTTTTTTLPLCGPTVCSGNPVCTNGQTCGLDTNGQCACVGPPPTCGQWGIIACGGTGCPAGEQCALENIAPPGCPQVPVCGCVPAP